MRNREDDEIDALTPELLLGAYSQGIFPMGEEDSDDVYWYRPDPRAVFPLEEFRVPRRLARTMRQGRLAGEPYRVSFNEAFGAVMRGCAEDRPIWITDRMLNAYTELHRIGHAHSVEVWLGERLVGGVYGVQLGAAFMAESKFHRVTDASKVALASLVARLRERGFDILEVQYLTEHLESLGAREIPLATYLRKLRRALKRSPEFASHQGETSSDSASPTIPDRSADGSAGGEPSGTDRSE
ncbi:MAG: leucyl/phenylalanyl-tRNA--protein transferase [Planctomycetota bacterium]